jgi:hypothetical protein
MPRKATDPLTPLELEIMKVPWATGPAATQTAQERLAPGREATKAVMLIAIGLAALALSACCLEKGRCPDSKPYVPVITAVRSLHLKLGERRSYRLSNPADGTTLRLDQESPDPMIGKGAGAVWVERDEAGRLLVAIETLDHGHAGEFGLLFADAGAIAAEDRDETIPGPGREWNLERDLGGGWWRVAYRLG